MTSIRENRMKMSDIFKLPFVMKEIEKDVDGIPTIAYILVEDGGKQSYNTAMLGYEWNGANHIVEGLNAHDTQLADIDRALGGLESFAEIGEAIADVPYVNVEIKIGEHKFKKQIFLQKNYFSIAHQTYAELREKYPKEEKDA